jgi:hypothetical protein
MGAKSATIFRGAVGTDFRDRFAHCSIMVSCETLFLPGYKGRSGEFAATGGWL